MYIYFRCMYCIYNRVHCVEMHPSRLCPLPKLTCCLAYCLLPVDCSTKQQCHYSFYDSILIYYGTYIQMRRFEEALFELVYMRSPAPRTGLLPLLIVIWSCSSAPPAVEDDQSHQGPVVWTPSALVQFQSNRLWYDQKWRWMYAWHVHYTIYVLYIYVVYKNCNFFCHRNILTPFWRIIGMYTKAIATKWCLVHVCNSWLMCAFCSLSDFTGYLTS